MLTVQSGHNHVCGAVNHSFKDQLGLVGLEVNIRSPAAMLSTFSGFSEAQCL